MHRRLPLLLVLAFIGCGGGGSPSRPGQVPLPFRDEDFDFELPALTYYAQDVGAAGGGGTATATLTWSNAANNLDLIWTNALCSHLPNDHSDTFTGEGCSGKLAESANSNTTSESITHTYTSAQGLRLWMPNRSGNTQSAHLKVRFQQ